MATILITGANRGLGLEMARQLSDAGHTIIGTARTPEPGDALHKVAQRVIPLDLSSDASVASFGKALGDEPIDRLINNGASGPSESGIAALDPGDLLEHLNINAVGPMRVIQRVLPNLRAGRGRQIVSISSGMGSIAQAVEQGGHYQYRTGKAALNMLNAVLSEELGKEGFTCVVMHPGWVRTRMGGERAPLTPEESVRGIVAVMEGLGTPDNGRFLQYDGSELPW
ncbi:MAG: SDR family oxidoreductase [Phycisphaerales bacterium]